MGLAWTPPSASTWAAYIRATAETFDTDDIRTEIRLLILDVEDCVPFIEFEAGFLAPSFGILHALETE